MATIREFIRWRESVDAVDPDLAEKINTPSLSDGENVRDINVDVEDTEAILAQLRRYE